ncbi:general stress protein [Mammaliicoccus sciuri]|uniref:general stress protein n=1 Tax=Mammaliicoccus sciuri TaxID=1296 RepID=UPI0021CE222D|nr:general stress protein [Mammaliicoccus sciuri]UXU83831.1 general stress protein [Mammaliicoccus sciuri]UXU93678.1 general stress protein [Mammaliicoccus sciuri]UXV15626.1 general stress protein [Mammaliicoccus sciuri]UXV23888.1 general stress protein [Mammaliicoccus sciuri]UXV26669.1 general stress protein [Mammaliicoccus sciuri]
MGKIEKFSNESDLLQRIDQLKEEGVGESDLQVISEDKLDDNSLDYTDVKVKNSRGSFSDKITALFSGESAEERVLSSLNVPEEELDSYKQELNNGKILLYVDNDNISDTENYDSDHPKDSQTGNEHYDHTKPFSSDESEDSGVSKGTAAGAGLGAGAAAHSSSDQDEVTNETSDFDKAEREDEFNQQDDVSGNDLTQDVDNADTEKTDAPSFDNEAETDRDVNTNRYGNNINKEDVAHDDVDDSNIDHQETSTSANLAGASGLGAAGYANEHREQQETEDDV